MVFGLLCLPCLPCCGPACSMSVCRVVWYVVSLCAVCRVVGLCASVVVSGPACCEPVLSAACLPFVCCVVGLYVLCVSGNEAKPVIYYVFA